MNFPCTVSQAAKDFNVSTSTVRRWVTTGHLQAERPEGKPMIIKAGDPPLSKRKFAEALCEAASKLGWGKGTYGISKDGDFHVLKGTDVIVIKYGSLASYQRRAIETLESHRPGAR